MFYRMYYFHEPQWLLWACPGSQVRFPDPKSLEGNVNKHFLSVSNFPTTTKLLGVFVFIHVGLYILLSTANYYD